MVNCSFLSGKIHILFAKPEMFEDNRVPIKNHSVLDISLTIHNINVNESAVAEE